MPSNELQNGDAVATTTPSPQIFPELSSCTDSVESALGSLRGHKGFRQVLAAKSVATVGGLASLSEADLKALTWLSDPVATIRRLLRDYQPKGKKQNDKILSSPCKPLEAVQTGSDASTLSIEAQQPPPQPLPNTLAQQPITSTTTTITTASLQASATITPSSPLPPSTVPTPQLTTANTSDQVTESRKRSAEPIVEPVAKTLKTMLDDSSLDGLSVDDLLDMQATVAALTSNIAAQIRMKMKK